MCEGKIYVYVCTCFFFIALVLLAKLIIIAFEYFYKDTSLGATIYRYSEKNIVSKESNTAMLLHNRYECTIRFIIETFSTLTKSLLQFSYPKILKELHVTCVLLYCSRNGLQSPQIELIFHSKFQFFNQFLVNRYGMRIRTELRTYANRSLLHRAAHHFWRYYVEIRI